MKINQITEQQVTEAAGVTVYIGMADEAYVGMHLIDRWETTSDEQQAIQQADKLAVEYMDDIDVVVLEFISGSPGFNEVHKAKGGRQHISPSDDRGNDNALGNDHEANFGGWPDDQR